MKSLSICVLLSAMFLFSCKDRNKVVIKDGEVSVGDAVKAADAMSKGVKDASDRWEARKAKGDTVAIPYKELESYLPEIPGYTKDGGAKGSQMDMPGMGNFSTTEQNFVNGDKRIKINIVDYNASQMAFSGATALYKMGFSAEDDDKKQGSTDLGVKDVAGYETVYKKDQRAELAVIAGDRFYITLSSEGSNDIDLLKNAGKTIASSLSSKF